MERELGLPSYQMTLTYRGVKYIKKASSNERPSLPRNTISQ